MTKMSRKYSKMKLVLLTLVLLVAQCAVGQEVVVTGTVSNTDGQVFKNGTYFIEFLPTPGVPGPFTEMGTGLTFTKQLSGTLNNSGAFSVSLAMNNGIQPAGSKWRFTFCPNASSSCGEVTLIITGPVDISGSITSAMPKVEAFAVRFPRAYADSQIVTDPKSANIYFNVEDNALRIKSNTGWISTFTGPPLIPPMDGDDLGNSTKRWDAFLLNVTAKNLNGIRFVEHFSEVDMGAKVNAAIADGGTLLYLPQGTYNYSTPIVNSDGVMLYGQGIYGDGTILIYDGTTGCAITLGHETVTGSESYGAGVVNMQLQLSNTGAVKALCLKEAGQAVIRDVLVQSSTASGATNANVCLYDGTTGGFGNNWNHVENLLCRYFNVGYEAHPSSASTASFECRDCKFLNSLFSGPGDGTIGIKIPANIGNGIKFIGGEVNGYAIGADISGYGVAMLGTRFEISDTVTAAIRLNAGATGNMFVGLLNFNSGSTGLVDNSGNATNQLIGASIKGDPSPGGYRNILNETIFTTNVLLSPASGSGSRYILTDKDSTYAGSTVMQAGFGSGSAGGALNLYGHSHASLPGWVMAGISGGSGGKFAVNNSALGGGTNVFTVDTSGNVVTNGSMSLVAGTGSSRVKAGGLLCVNTTSTNNITTVNTWTYITCTVPANTLNSDGTTLRMRVTASGGTTASISKGYQVYWGGTGCSGTGASACSGGCQLSNNATTNASINFLFDFEVIRSTSNNQVYLGTVIAGTSIQNNGNGSCTVTDTANADIVFAFRNATDGTVQMTFKALTLEFLPK